MMFGSRLAKFGKGKNLSAIMFTKNVISIYFFQEGITKKEVIINGDTLILKTTSEVFPYNEAIPLDSNYFVTRLDKSLGIVKNEQ